MLHADQRYYDLNPTVDSGQATQRADQQEGCGGDEYVGDHGCGRDQVQRAWRLPGEYGCRTQPDWRADQGADRADDHTFGDDRPTQRGLAQHPDALGVGVLAKMLCHCCSPGSPATGH